MHRQVCQVSPEILSVVLVVKIEILSKTHLQMDYKIVCMLERGGGQDRVHVAALASYKRIYGPVPCKTQRSPTSHGASRPVESRAADAIRRVGAGVDFVASLAEAVRTLGLGLGGRGQVSSLGWGEVEGAGFGLVLRHLVR